MSERDPVELFDVDIAGQSPDLLPAYDPVRFQEALERARISDAVRRQLKAEQRAGAKPIECRTLRERLQQAPREPRWLIQGWHPAGGRVIVVAKGKGGKTTLIGNLLRTYTDGDPFLGEAKATPVDGHVVLLDTEMTDEQSEFWLRSQGISGDDRLTPIYLRGNIQSFDLFEPECFRSWVNRLKALGCRHLVIDPLKPLLDVFGLDENSEAGRLLVQIDALLVAAAIPTATIVHHMGWTAERARGSSRLLDWPDATWTLTTKTEEPTGPRYLSAYGRDVDQAERELLYDKLTRRLSLSASAQSRRESDLAEIVTSVAAYLRELPCGEANQREIEREFKDATFGRDKVRAALQYGVRVGLLSQSEGLRGATLYRDCASARDCATTARADEPRSTARVRDSLTEPAQSRSGLLSDPRPAVNGEPFTFDANPTGAGPTDAEEVIP
jgi:hypothetical protein